MTQAVPQPVPTRLTSKYPSNLTRSERRRRQKARERAALSHSHAQAFELAQQLIWLADNAPDEQARADLLRQANALRVRYSTNENDQRLAVLHQLEQRELQTLAEISSALKLAPEVIQPILNDFASPDVDLVELHTMGGRRNAGCKGTVLYYRLTSHPAPKPRPGKFVK